EWNLQGTIWQASTPPRPSSKLPAAQPEPKSQYLPAAGRRRNVCSRQSSKACQLAVALTGDQDALAQVVLLDEREHGFRHRPLSLEINVEVAVRQGLDDVEQRRDPEPLVAQGVNARFAQLMPIRRIEGRQVTECQLPNCPRTIRGAVDRGIVANDELAVLGEMHVEFHHVASQTLSVAKSEHGVFRPQPGATTVSERERPRRRGPQPLRR